MNVKKKLMQIPKIHNVVCRDNGSLEIYSKGNVQNEVINFLNVKSLDACFVRIDFYDTTKW